MISDGRSCKEIMNRINQPKSSFHIKIKSAYFKNSQFEGEEGYSQTYESIVALHRRE